MSSNAVCVLWREGHKLASWFFHQYFMSRHLIYLLATSPPTVISLEAVAEILTGRGAIIGRENILPALLKPTARYS